MNILVINSGSSSLKSQLIEVETGKVIAKVLAERVGTAETFLTFKSETNVVNVKKPGDHQMAIAMLLKLLTDPVFGVIDNLEAIDAIGHRVVHGGELYCKPMLITSKVIDGIRNCKALAPLHNPACLLGIAACKKLMPEKKQVAIFDTAFHQTMSEERFLYPIPRRYYEKYQIRKYGFHGISHNYLAETLREIIGDVEMKAINFHLGQGASLCAVKDGKSVDTTMGLSPLAGILMGTRSGDIDPAIVSYLAQVENIDHNDVVDILNKESGMLALSGVSADFRDILEEADNGNERAKMSLERYYENVAQYAAKFVITLDGAKQFVFAGGIGENSPIVRSEICKKLHLFGVELDETLNAQAIGKKMKISSSHSAIDVYVIPTNEELLIARQTVQTVETAELEEAKSKTEA